MAGQEPGRFGSTSMTPPTEIGYATEPPKQSSWPMVIGIIAIVLGAGGVLTSCWGTVAPLLTDALAQAMPAGPSRAQLDAMKEWAVVLAAISAGALVLAAWLLTGGIGLVKRTAWARRAILVWAVAKALFVAGQSVASYFIQHDTFDAMTQSDPTMSQMPAGFSTAVATASLVFGLVWGWALPVFMLIWFARGKIRAEVATWDGGRVRCPNPSCQAQNRGDVEYCAKCGARLPGGMA